MIAKASKRGHSFKGVVAYLMHDKDHSPTSERVAWHEIGNIYTESPETAARIMAYTEQSAGDLKDTRIGRPAEAGGVYHYSLSWAQGETPEPDHMKTQAVETLVRLGLGEHQYILVAHSDTEHPHVHVVVNLTHPDTGKRSSLTHDRHCLQGWALEYEKRYAMHCVQREVNAQARASGTPLKHRDQKQDYSKAVTQAYKQADNGAAFIHALREQGLELAAARRGAGFLIVDGKGDVQKLGRQLDMDEKGKAKTTAINAKLGDIDRDTLPDADQLSQQIRSAQQEAAKEKTEPKQEPETQPIPTQTESGTPLTEREQAHLAQALREHHAYLLETPIAPPMEHREQMPTYAPQDWPRPSLSLREKMAIGVTALEAAERALLAISHAVTHLAAWAKDGAVWTYEQMRIGQTEQHHEPQKTKELER